MCKEVPVDTIRFYARIAGLAYVAFTVLGLVGNFSLNRKLSDYGADATSGVLALELHYRLGIAVDTLMFLAVLLASVAFYIVLKHVHAALALLALCLRLCEVILGGVAVVGSSAILALATNADYGAVLELGQLRALARVLSSVRSSGFQLGWVFMGLAGVITFYLFSKSKYVPKAWVVWGLFTYVTMIIYTFSKILIAGLPREAMMVMFPGALFELTFGLWLLARSVGARTHASEIGG